MASLQSCCPTNTKPSPSPSPNPNPHSFPFPKPSHQLAMYARRSHRFAVSCSRGGNDGGSISIDRRNMLLGLGGLYGTGRTLNARADPILAPDLSKCDHNGAIDGRTGDNLGVDCCPPFTDTVTDYKFPTFSRFRYRRAAHLVDRDYIDKYNEGIRQMKLLDVTDPEDPCGFMQQSNIHCAYCNGPHDQVGYPGLDLQIHGSWLFFAWHRWYLYFYERILGSLIGDPTFALPFWNWDNPPGMQMPPMFHSPRPGSYLYDPKRNQAHIPPAIVDLSGTSTVTDCAQLISDNLSLMYNEVIGSVASAEHFMGFAMRAGGTPSGPGSHEKGSHTGIHRWVGDPREHYHENMGNFYSAGRDPMFYSHHANVDRMWTIWKSLPADYSKEILDCDFLNASFVFYDENRQLMRVKVVDCLDHRKMGYKYEDVPTPWLNYRPPKNTTPTSFSAISLGVPTAADKTTFPLTLANAAKLVVPKTTKGRANEVLVLDNIVTDPTKFVKFDVYVNDADDEPHELNKAEYAGTYSHLPHNSKATAITTSINLSLKELYENVDIDPEDDSVLVTIVPRSNGQDVTIGGVKIIIMPTP